MLASFESIETSVSMGIMVGALKGRIGNGLSNCDLAKMFNKRSESEIVKGGVS